MSKAKVKGHTIPSWVRNLLQVQEVCCQSDVSYFGVIKDLDFDSLSQRGKLLDEGDLLIPDWTAGGAGDGRLALKRPKT